MLQPQDRNVVSGQISVLNQRLSQLEASEAKLSEELSGIRAKIDKLRAHLAALESRMAAVWSLPNEILAYIFEIGVMEEANRAASDGDDEDEDGDEEHPPSLGFQVLVSHVCRMFREVAIHTPSLWSRVHILDLQTPRLDYIQVCMERSGCSLLDVIIDCEDSLYEADPEAIDLLMSYLVPHIHRFQRLTVRLFGFRSLYLVMQHLDQPAPQLEVLELSDVDYESGFDEEDPFEPSALRAPITLFAGEMPKLEGLSLDGVHVAWSQCNFAGLLDLHLEYHAKDVRPTYAEFKGMIDASPALHSLCLRSSAPLLPEDNAESSVYPPLHMERLEDLRISNIPSDYATILISLIKAPNLQSLSLTDLDTNDYSGFLRRIIGPPSLFPMLNALKLSSIEISDGVFEDFLRAHSKITHLGLYFNNTKLNYLEPRGPDNEVLCPKLECLRCVSGSTLDIKELLEKRLEAGFAIPTIQIDKKTAEWDGKGYMKWIRENAVVDIIEPSEGSDEEWDESDSEWATDEDDEIGGLPFISMEGFSDEDVEDDDFEDASEMDVDVDGSVDDSDSDD